MRVVLFCNDRSGLEIATWLRGRPDADIAAVVLNAPARRPRRADEIRVLFPDLDRRGLVLTGDTLRHPQTQTLIEGLGAEMGVSLFFAHIFTPALMKAFPRGIVNLHPSLLPYNRGRQPAVWSIIDGTPAGVTLHMVDEGIDTGPVLAQQEVQVRPHDTGSSLYRRLEEAAVELFLRSWPALCEDALAPVEQDHDRATGHPITEFQELAHLDPDRSMPVGRLIDILRARCFNRDDCVRLRTPDGGTVRLFLELIPD
ncbi:formyltransferase family protein [Planomonospora parontospora]|uniref:formyltransferase family protein n=1 Tax=Planomonospora parontospora TaxID=58119 RepID=UPI0016707979|nr:formyltransferase family protein [Planomonospora parontospora]GGL05671.1 formyl transferase [Planomonospora parontospora subsp. antibiotica]GII14287.1 formyl transferase [Planomonospora parontospora subsp. antibiotica]